MSSHRALRLVGIDKERSQSLGDGQYLVRFLLSDIADPDWVEAFTSLETPDAPWIEIELVDEEAVLLTCYPSRLVDIKNQLDQNIARANISMTRRNNQDERARMDFEAAVKQLNFD